MTDQKKQLLEKTYQDWLGLFLDENTPLDQLESLVAPDIMGYGTSVEEKVFGIAALKDLILLGREQGRNLEDMQMQPKQPDLRQIISGNDMAIFAGEVHISYKLGGFPNHMSMRISTVLIYQDNAWKVTHWHGSVGVETEEGDTWHADELRLKNQKLERIVEERTAELKQSISDLKATQTQLIHAEKMASLGELTAGIAHEIQNPLNFVNNFSEVNTELIDEMNEELNNGDIDEAKAISADIKQNLEKITHHGKRADSIVKGMLQHSGNGTGIKEPTDINQLTDEYFRLAYQGLRAKDKSFNATLETDYSENVGEINIIPQDIGRVILNLFTNAFYAVDEKKLTSKSDAYKPTVSVSTEKTNANIVITVRDNGNGIPEKVLNKIFQPFFTTKPSGKGTGLGLSMSYDIVKAHKGEITINTAKEKFTEFKISLPIKKNSTT